MKANAGHSLGKGTVGYPLIQERLFIRTTEKLSRESMISHLDKAVSAINLPEHYLSDVDEGKADMGDNPSDCMRLVQNGQNA